MNDSNERRNTLLLLCIMPLFFSSNIIFGRAAVDLVEPFTLAFLRWFFTALILLPFVWNRIKSNWALIRSMTASIFLLGFLAMWISGAIVYVALKYTSATNGTLIYTSSPLIILVIEWLFKGRQFTRREIIGILFALIGVIIIVVKGSISNLIAIEFNSGDLLFVLAAFSWALYSVQLKSERYQPLQTLPLFMIVAASGALLLAPFAIIEVIWLNKFPTSLAAWGNIIGIIIFASLLAFGIFQNGVKVVGASTTGLFLYLLPVYGVTLAILFLGETLMPYHGWGIVLVISGLVLATLPTTIINRT